MTDETVQTKPRAARKVGARKPKGKDRKTAIILAVSIVLALGNLALFGQEAMTRGLGWTQTKAKLSCSE